jgi:hypothetical protein
VLDRLLGFSTLRVLVFTLPKHVALVQSQLTLCVFLVDTVLSENSSEKFSLEHYGTWSASYVFVFCETNAVAGMAFRIRLHVPLCMAVASIQSYRTYHPEVAPPLLEVLNSQDDTRRT